MPQMGFDPPRGQRMGRIHYDGSSSESGVRCEVGRCYKPCEHCNAKQCDGRVIWSTRQLERGDVVYCTTGRHPYKLILSG